MSPDLLQALRIDHKYKNGQPVTWANQNNNISGSQYISLCLVGTLLINIFMHYQLFAAAENQDHIMLWL